MTEPRQRARPKGPQFPTNDLSACLTAFGDTFQPLPETIRVLDEILTDYILETCAVAAIPSQLQNRSKVKVEDFKWAMRRDARKLGRMTELLQIEKVLRDKRKAFEYEDGAVVKGQGGGDGEPKKRGRKRKVRNEEGEGDGEGTVVNGERAKSAKSRRTEEGSSDVE